METRRHIIVLIFLSVLLPRLLFAASPLGTLPDGFNPPATTGNIFGMTVQPDGKIVVCGISQTASAWVGRYNSDGSLDSGFTPPTLSDSAIAYAVAVQPDGKILVGGTFSTVNGLSQRYLVRLNSNGTRDESFTPNLLVSTSGGTSTIRTIVLLPNGQILIGGNFNDPLGKKNIARLDSDGSFDASFTISTNSMVNVIAFQGNGKMVIAGNFTTVSPPPATGRRFIARFNTDESLDLTFTPPATTSAPIYGMALQSDGSMIIGGQFTTINGVVRNHLAKFDKNGTLDPFFDPNVVPGVGFPMTIDSVVLQPDGKILVAGYFTSVNGVPCNNLVRLTSDGLIDGTITDQPNNHVRSVVLQGDQKFLAAGDFSSPRSHIARYYDYGTVDSDVTILLNNVPNSGIINIAPLMNGDTYIGGYIRQVNTIPRNRIAKLKPDWSLDGIFNPDLDNELDHIVPLSDGSVLIAGHFLAEQGVSVLQSFLAKIDPVTGVVDQSFAPVISYSSGVVGDFGWVTLLAVQKDGKILIGGYFDKVNDTRRINMARLNADGTLDEGFVPPDFDGPPMTFYQEPDGHIMVAGLFDTRTIVRLDGTTGAIDEIFAVNLAPIIPAYEDDTVFIYSLLPQPDGKIVVAGYFGGIGGNGLPNVGRINADGTLDTSFRASTSALTGWIFDAFIYTAALQSDGKIIIAGSFDYVTGNDVTSTKSKLARLNPDGSVDETFDLGTVDNELWARIYLVDLMRDGKLVFGGNFDKVNDTTHNHLARTYNGVASEELRVTNGGTEVRWLRSGSSPDLWRAWFEDSPDGVVWAPLGEGSRISGGWGLSGFATPHTPNRYIRANGYATVGNRGLTAHLVQSVRQYTPDPFAQSITFPAIPEKVAGDIDFDPGATASSGLAVSYTSSNPAVATIVNGEVHVVGAGSAEITASQPGNDAYFAAPDVTRTLTVIKLNQTITYSLSGKTYGDADFSPGATASSGLTVSYASSNPAVATVVGNTIHITGAGSTDITASQAGNWQFNAAPAVTLTLDVSKAPLTVRAVPVSRNYGAANPTFTASYTGFVNSETAAVLSGTPSLSTAATPLSAVGIYAISAGIGTLASSNYSFTVLSDWLTVTKAPLTVTADNQSRLYGDANPPLTATYTGFVNAETAAVLAGAPALVTAAVAASPAGGYGISAGPGTLASPNYTFTLVAGTLTVNKATLTVTADNQTRRYGEANPVLTAALSGFVNGDSAAVVAGSPSVTTTATAATAVGSYPITAAAGNLAAANYGFSFVPGTLSITKAPLTVTAEDKSRSYGEANPPLTAAFSGFVNDEGVGNLAGAPTLATAAQPTSAPGGYAIGIEQGSLDSANYSFTFTPGTLTVSRAPLAIRADDKSRSYGAANPPLTVSYSGFVNGETAAVLSGAPALATAAVAATAPGQYPITLGAGTLSSANYAFTTTDGTLTVTRTQLIVKAEDKSRSYGSANPPLTAAITGFVNGETAAVLTGSPLLSTTATAASAAGSYAITASAGTLSSANYSFTFQDGLLDVATVPLSVSADNQSRSYGSANPPLTVTFSGFVNGETAAVLAGAPSVSASAQPSSGPGSYAIACRQGTLSSPNYSFTFHDGTLDISRAPLTITAVSQSRSYGVDNDPLAASYDGFMNGETVSVLSGTPALATAAVKGTPPGSYPISIAAGTLSSANYAFSFVPGTVSVTPAPLTITADSKARRALTPNPVLTATFTGLLNGDTADSLGGTPALATTAQLDSPVGSYPITVSIGSIGSVNYSYTFVDGVLLVATGQQSIDFPPMRAKTYGDGDFTPNAVASSGLAVSFASSNPEVAAVVDGKIRVVAPGSADITATQAGDAVFDPAPEVTRTLVVHPPPWNGVAFDGIDDVVRIADAPALSFAASFSIETWLRLDAPLPDYTGILSKGGAGSPFDGYQLLVFGNRIAAEIGDGAASIGVSEGLVGTSALDDGRWHHVALVVDRPRESALLYFDGRLEATVALGALGAPIGNAAELGIGTDRQGLRFFKGQLDEVRLWNVARSRDEIRGALAQIVDPLTQPELAGYFHLDEGDAGAANPLFTTAPERTGNLGSGLLTGFVLADATSNWVSSGAFLPLLETAPVSNLTTGSLTSGATVYPNYYPPTDRGLCWGSAANPDLTGNCRQFGSGVGEFSGEISGLAPGTAYHLRAYATNSMGTAYGNDVTFTTDRWNQGIDFPPLPPGTYGDPDLPLGGSTTSGLPITYASSDPGVAVIVNNEIHITGAGTTTITASQPGNGSYNPAADIPRSFTVNRAPLTVRADDASRPYRSANPPLTATYSGFVLGESVATALTGAPLLTTPAAEASPAGSYPVEIALGTLAARNYAITLAGGTLTVSRLTLAVTAEGKERRYGAVNPPLTASYSGFASGEDASVLSGTPRLATAAVPTSPVGSYPITVAAGTLASPNYAFVFADGTLTVTKAPQSIEFPALRAKTYGDGNFTPTATASSALPVTLTSSNPAVASVENGTVRVVGPGTAEITASQPGDAGYDPAADVTRTLLVHPPPWNAVAFDGIDDVVRVLDAPALAFPGSFTMETWLRVDGPLPDYTGIVSKGGPGSPLNGYALVVFGDRIAAEIGDGAAAFGVADGLVGTSTLNDGQWHQVALVVDREQESALLYFDGRVEATVPLTAMSLPVANTEELTIGADRDGTRYFRGELDELRLWGVARSRDEIRSYSSAIVGPLSEPQLAGYFHFDEGDAGEGNASFTTLPERTGRSGSGTLTGFALAGTTSNWVRSGAFLPLLETAPITNLTATALTSGGTVYPNYYPPTDRGFCWGTDPNPDLGQNCRHLGSGVGSFAGEISGLTPGTAYHVRAFAGNVMGTAFGNDVTFTTRRIDQSTDFPVLPPKTYGDPDFPAGGTTTSGLPITYASSDPSVAVIVGNEIHITGAGTTTITASQGGNPVYNPAGDVTRTFVVAKAPITVRADDKARAYRTENPPLTATYSGFVNGEGLSALSGGCTLGTGATVDSPVGAYDIVAGIGTLSSRNYEFMLQNGTLNVVKNCQEIIFPAIGDRTYGDPPFRIVAVACSGLNVTFASSQGNVVRIDGNLITIVGAGTATITASQTGTGDVNGAPDVSQTLTVHRSGQGISFTSIARHALGDPPFSLNATASSGLAVSYQSSAPEVAIIQGNLVMITGVGTTVITAVQPGNGNYDAALSISQPLTVAQEGIPPLIALSTLPFGAVTANPVLNIEGLTADSSGVASLTVNGSDYTGEGALFSSSVVMAAGENVVTVAARDSAGNETTDSRLITLDQAAPVITLALPADNSMTGTPGFELKGSVTPGAEASFTLNGDTAQPLSVDDTGAFAGSGTLLQGVNTILVTASMGGKNSRVKRSVALVEGKPGVAITEPSCDVRTESGTITVKGTASGGTAPLTLLLEVNGTGYAPLLAEGVFQQQIPLGASGEYRVKATVRDAQGNSGFARRNVIRLERIGGDVNGDGAVDIVDAAAVMRVSLEVEPATGQILSHGDVAPLVNGVPEPDGKIDVGDVLVLMRKIVGLVNF